MNVSCCLVSVVLSAKNSTHRKKGLDDMIFWGAGGEPEGGLEVLVNAAQIKGNNFKNVLDMRLAYSSLTLIEADCF